MVTKSRAFQRSQPRKKPKPARVEKTKKPKGNRGARAGRKASVAFEISATTPSRKSTRGSENRGRSSESLERRERERDRAPKAQATRESARGLTVRGKRGR